MEQVKTELIRTTVLLTPDEKAEIEKAIKKIKEDAGNGITLSYTGFMANAGLEKAREINQGK